MRFEFKPSFDKSVRSLRSKEKEEVKIIAGQAVDILSQDKLIHKGIGLKRLRGNYWEIRKSIKARLLFKWEGDLIEFILAGSHNDIRRFLKNI